MLLTTIDSKELLKNHDKKEFKKFLSNSLVVVASDALQVSGENENTTHIPQIVPPAIICSKHMSGDVAGFNRMYLKFIQSPHITVILASLLMNAAKEDMNLVFLCNTTEDSFGYLDILGNYMHAAFQIEPAPLKKIIKGKTKEYEADTEDILEKCEERFARAQDALPSVVEDVAAMFKEQNEKDKKKKKKKK